MDDLQSLSHKDVNLIKLHFQKIFSVCGNKFEKGNGSYLFDGFNYQYTEDIYKKQSLLFNKVKGKKDVLEIGTYMGHSVLLMLVANPRLNITTIDINDEFSKPAINYLISQFPEADIDFIHGDSLKVINKLKKKFDFFHIDGCHKNKIVTKEFNKCKKLCKSDQLEIIFDDNYNLKVLVKNIETSYQIAEKISKGHSWYTNLYVKINLPKSKFKNLLVNMIFNIKNISKYVILKLKKLSNFKKI